MKKGFHFENKMVFGYVKNFLLENKNLFIMIKNGVENCALWEDFKKIPFLLEKDIEQNKFENNIVFFFKVKEWWKKLGKILLSKKFSISNVGYVIQT